MNEICQTCAGICDKDIKVHIPDPVVLPGPYNTFNHVKLKPRGATCRIRFVINIKIVTVKPCIICGEKIGSVVFT
jgi:hypothetical protein